MTIRILKITDPLLCSPLGPAIRPEEPEKADPILAFNKGDHCGLWVTEYDYEMIQEEDRRQIKSKGAAQASASGNALTAEKAADSRPLPVAAPPQPAEKPHTFAVGQLVRVLPHSMFKECSGKTYYIALVHASCGGVTCGALNSRGEPKAEFYFQRNEIELIPSEPKEADGQWIEWKGGECPILGGETAHEVRFRDGRQSGRDLDPPGWRWTHVGTDSDIVAYRLVKP